MGHIIFSDHRVFNHLNLAGLACGILFCGQSLDAQAVHHFVFFNRDRARIAEPAFLSAKALEGAQLKYTWRELEPGKDAYDFAALRGDLNFLDQHGKKLFIQMQDASFAPTITNVPRYLIEDAQFHGGTAKQYNIKGDDEDHAVAEGWVARRWDPAVQQRLHRLLLALGAEFDGRIEGINLAETAVGFGQSGRLFPPGFTPQIYRDAIISNMTILKRAFPKSVPMQYANFMPGEWLPGQDRFYLRDIYARAKDLKVALGAPDLLPYKPGQMNHCYPLLRASAASIPTGIAVQDGNYEYRNPQTSQRITIQELVQFATSYLKVQYIFWSSQEPYYSEKVIPFLVRGIKP